MGRRQMIFLLILPMTMILSVALSACGSENSSTSQTGPVVTSSKSVSTNTSRTGTSTRNGDSTTGHSAVPIAEEIQQDLIGESITDPQLGEWVFEDESEFLEFTIENEDVSDSRITFVVDMKLKDIGDGRIYNGQARVIYKKVGNLWEFSDIKGEYRSGGPSV